MPELGEIKSAAELGYKTNKRIWAVCEKCGRKRWVELTHGKPTYSICKSCTSRKRVGPESANWKGGGSLKKGYTRVSIIDIDEFFRPMAGKNNYVLEHRLIMAKHLKRCLLPWEVVHHINGNKHDNKLENLRLLPNVGNHDTMIEVHLKRQEKMLKKLKAEIQLLRWENEQLREKCH